MKEKEEKRGKQKLLNPSILHFYNLFGGWAKKLIIFALRANIVCAPPLRFLNRPLHLRTPTKKLKEVDINAPYLV